MAVDLLPNTGPGSLEYIPGTKTFVGINCALSGDRITFTGQSFKHFTNGVSNVVPDKDGFMPHFAIAPRYNKASRLDSEGIAAVRDKLGSPTSGYIDVFPWVRVDFGSIWLPYAANVQIQGGAGPGDPEGTLLITLELERRGWHQNYNNQEVAVIEKRDSKGTFTVSNVKSGVAVPRPTNAIDAFCPDGVDLRLDNGPGTYSEVAAMGARTGGRSAPLGPYNFITPAADVGSIIFTVQL